VLITVDKLKSIYKKYYKDLTEIFILDPVFTCPTYNQIKKIVEIIRTDIIDLKYKKDLFDCDDYSLLMNARVHTYFYEHSIDSYQSTFGEVFIIKQSLFNNNVYHMMNSFVDDKFKLYFVEPQSGKFYLAKSKDNPVIEVLHVRI
jgi:hypothetical protein